MALCPAAWAAFLQSSPFPDRREGCLMRNVGEKHGLQSPSELGVQPSSGTPDQGTLDIVLNLPSLSAAPP